MNAVDLNLRGAEFARDPSGVSLALVLCGGLDLDTAAREMRRGARFYAIATGDEAPKSAQSLADELGVSLNVIHFPADQVAADFFYLLINHRCVVADEFFLGYLAMHLCEAILETVIFLALDEALSERARSTLDWIAHRYGKALIAIRGEDRC